MRIAPIDYERLSGEIENDLKTFDDDRNGYYKPNARLMIPHCDAPLEGVSTKEIVDNLVNLIDWDMQFLCFGPDGQDVVSFYDFAGNGHSKEVL